MPAAKIVEPGRNGKKVGNNKKATVAVLHPLAVISTIRATGAVAPIDDRPENHP